MVIEQYISVQDTIALLGIIAIGIKIFQLKKEGKLTLTQGEDSVAV